MAYHLDWEQDFSIAYGNVIHLPEGCILWRGYETQEPSILSRPSYYGSYETANAYAQLSNRALGAFKTTKPLRLLDVRFMKVLLKQFFEDNMNEKITQEDQKCILAINISFGLCSLAHQIKLMKYAYKGSTNTMQGLKDMEAALKQTQIIEQPGIRVGETYVDGKSVAFLKGLLGTLVDGFISPRLKSAFHHDNGSISPELILFDPKGINLQQVSSIPTNLPNRNINDILIMSYSITSIRKNQMESAFYMTGGNKDNHYFPPIEEFNTLLRKNDKRAVKEYMTALKMGNRWRLKTNTIHTFHLPKPTIYPSIFTETTISHDRSPLKIE
jgi:hypothetical protein